MKGSKSKKHKGYISLKMARKNKGERRQEWKPLMLAGNVVILKMKQLVERKWEKIPPCISYSELKQQMKLGRGSCQTALGRNEAVLHPLKGNSGLGNYTHSQVQEFSKPAPAAAADVP